MKTKKLLTAITILTIVLVTGCKKDDYEEIFVVCPEVEIVRPIDGAT